MLILEVICIVFSMGQYYLNPSLRKILFKVVMLDSLKSTYVLTTHIFISVIFWYLLDDAGGLVSSLYFKISFSVLMLFIVCAVASSHAAFSLSDELKKAEQIYKIFKGRSAQIYEKSREVQLISDQIIKAYEIKQLPDDALHADLGKMATDVYLAMHNTVLRCDD